MRRFGQIVASAVISASLIASSTAAVASNSSLPPAPSTDGWMALSMLTPRGAAVLDSTALAAAQPDTVPPPPPPAYAGPGTPPIPVIIVWLAVLGVIIYIATKSNGNHHVPNSPA
jgi:hypothetical protein